MSTLPRGGESEPECKLIESSSDVDSLPRGGESEPECKLIESSRTSGGRLDARRPVAALDATDAGLSGVVVLGMGRSGTSAVTRAFHFSGYFVGAQAELMPADESNPTGHFEHWDIYRANEQALARLDGAWFEVPAGVERHAGDPTYVAPLRDALSSLLAAAGEAPLVLKDPRIGMLLALWWPLIEELLHPVLVVRDPVEVALSLERRDLTALPVGMAMWEVYVTSVLAGLKDKRTTVIPYRDILEVPGLAPRLVAEASTMLRPGLRDRVDPTNACSALEPHYRRNRHEESSPAVRLTDHQDRLWEMLASLAPATTVLRPPAWATRPSREAKALTAYELRRQRVSARLAQDAAEAERAREEIAAAGHELATQNAALADTARRLAGSSQRVGALERQLRDREDLREAAERRAAASEHWLGQIKGSLSWRATAPLRSLKRRALGSWHPNGG